ncbi:acyl-[acyl-carrier-protein]--UDP-N-acetylglucosamine O-acyltransferase [Andreprevotia lacus DSM 23236]|jgi:UDP-N-acetylglucosamine acyltransferase|uniref:Acyl-[acyl-carrier-protein]--UDP-N-acetylglucosamine O-acyltransferase n=1 Tax=Andreprevotia lacus DSM 23236 TaxID=1121001 RepID=A0A1W1XLL0_9NEIS|nr:acyl-ACP--UDP-N-acetylglucosamine O-acyltransferase [Andreprevotia lacus]SMC24775.1 acyl-[acyl-carrier-protein]--UDP-N-acetylglucosamine O-acyltransferase [Andreprevotia lacus DSM 23236]
MTLIHPSAIVDPKARLAADVQVGPFSVIGPDVEIGAGTVVGPHVVIDGVTRIGENNRFHPFAHIGCTPQDLKYAGEPTRLEIGNGNTFHQSITVSTGTTQDEGLTRIGDDNWIMAYVHIAHDCRIGSHCILANNATLAGHVHIDDWVFLGGFTTVHQFCKIGAHAMTAFTAAVSQDVPPYVTAAGNRAIPAGINSEGLRRRGFSAEQIAVVKRAYKTLYRQNLPLDEARAQIETAAQSAPELQLFVDFFAASTRGLIR